MLLPEERLFINQQGAINSLDGLPVTDYRFRETENLNFLSELLFGYNNKFGKHSVDVIANFSDQKFFYTTSQLEDRTLTIIPNWDQRQLTDGDFFGFYDRDRQGLIGAKGRASYNLIRNITLMLLCEEMVHQILEKVINLVTFPSANAAWRISAEKSMKVLRG